MANETDVKEIWRGSQILSCIRCAEKKNKRKKTEPLKQKDKEKYLVPPHEMTLK